MGHRASYVVIRKRKVSAYQDHWGALSCTFALLDGPEEAADVDAEETGELMAWAWAEGGYLIDFDRRVAIVFGVPDFDPDDSDGMPKHVVASLTAALAAIEAGPRKYLELVAPKWPGWTLTWDDRGVDAFGAHLKRYGLASQLKVQPPHEDDFDAPITVIAAGAARTAAAKRKSSARATKKRPPVKATKKPAAKIAKKRR